MKQFVAFLVIVFLAVPQISAFAHIETVEATDFSTDIEQTKSVSGTSTALPLSGDGCSFSETDNSSIMISQLLHRENSPLPSPLVHNDQEGTAATYSQKSFWAGNIWSGPTSQFSGGMTATFDGVTNTIGGIQSEDWVGVLPINLAYGSSDTYSWIQFMIIFKYGGAVDFYLEQNNYANGKMSYGYYNNSREWSTSFLWPQTISVPYAVGHTFLANLFVYDSTHVEFALTDENTMDMWTKVMQVPGTNVLYMSDSFSPATTVEGLVSTSVFSITGMPYFEVDIINCMSSYDDNSLGAPSGVDYYPIKTFASGYWRWVALSSLDLLPQPDIQPIRPGYEYPQTIILGQTATIDVPVKNGYISGGGTASWMTIQISFPTNPPISSISVDAGTTVSNPRVWKVGESVHSGYGFRIGSSSSTATLSYPLVEGASTWSGGDVKHLRVKVTPTVAGSFTFRVKSVGAYKNSAINWDPTIDTPNVVRDQQSEFAYEYTIVVNPIQPFDFAFSPAPSPSSQAVTAGGSTSYQVYVQLTSGQAQSVSLSCSPSITGVSYSFNPQSGNPTFSSTLNVQTSSDTPATTYTLTITGTGGGQIHSTTVQLVVNPKGNNAPTAVIDDIHPNPAVQGDTVYFSGHGSDPDGDSIVGWSWRSSIDGSLSSSSSFSTSSLSVGTHTIYFKVKDSREAWSTEATRILTINPSQALSCSVRVDRGDRTYYVGDTVIIYYSVSETCDGRLTIYKPDGTYTRYDLSGISSGVESYKTGTAGYPIGRRDVVFECWKESQSAQATCEFYVYERGINHPPYLTSGQVDPVSGLPDTTFTFWVKYYDQDNDPAVMKTIWVYDSDRWWSFDMSKYSGDPLSGQWFVVRLYGFTIGTHDFYFQFADGRAEVREPQSGYLQFLVGSVDLVVSDISWSAPASGLKEGDTTTFSVYIKNQGTVNAGSFKTAYYIDGLKKGEWQISSLAVGQTSTQTFTWTATYGAHTVKAFADSGYIIKESDETNNPREESFTVSGRPDLTVASIAWAPSSPKEGETVTFSVNIKNQGNEGAGSFKTAYYIDGTKLGEWAISSLSAGQTSTQTFTWSATYGAHTVKAFADSGNSIQEKDENNNPVEKSFTVAGKPDLIVSSIDVSPTSVVEGQIVTFNVSVKNQGTVNAGGFTVAYYIDGNKLADWSVSSLYVGKTVSKTFTWSAIEGTHSVKVVADYKLNVDEKVETNNEATRTVQVGPKPKPDLLVSSLVFSPDHPVESDTVNFTITVKNDGTLRSGSFKTTYYMNKTKLGEFSITSLEIGQSISKAFSWVAVKGNHTFDVFVDSGFSVSERSETNNLKSQTLLVPGRPDLVISDIVWSPSVLKEGESVNFTVSIRNQGNEDSGPFKIAYSIDGTNLGELSLSSLLGGQNTSVVFTWTAAFRSRLVRVVVDPANAIREKDENNNIKEKAFAVVGKPDLIVSNISWAPSSTVEDDKVTFTVTIKNQGNASAGSFKATYYVDDLIQGEWSLTSLSNGQAINKTFIWIATAGNHTVKAYADSASTVDESNETNNLLEKSFQTAIRPKPDLIVDNIFWSPPTPVEGDTINFTIIIKNNGTLKSDSFKAAYYINQTKLGEWSITGLLVDQNISKTFSWTGVKGNHIVDVFVDSGFIVSERNESNNRNPKTLAVLGKPDLLVTDISWVPSSPKESDTVNFTAHIKNQGNGDADHFRVDYYIDGSKLGELSVPGLLSGQNTTVAFDWTAIFRTHVVRAVVDSGFEVREKAENNNVKEKSVTVAGKPDLTISKISYSPISPVQGLAVVFTVTIRNNGNASAGSFNVTYYVDYQKAGEWFISSLGSQQYTTKTYRWVAPAAGNHTFSVIADLNDSVDEVDEANNEQAATFSCGAKAGIANVAFIAKAFGTESGDANWNQAADLNDDGKINVLDMAIIAKRFETTV